MSRATHCRLCKQPLPATTPQRGRPIRYCNAECRARGLKAFPSRPKDSTAERAQMVLRAFRRGLNGEELAREYGPRSLANAQRTLRRLGVEV